MLASEFRSGMLGHSSLLGRRARTKVLWSSDSGGLADDRFKVRVWADDRFKVRVSCEEAML